MDARLDLPVALRRFAILAAAFFSLGASHRTQNFVVSAPDPGFARQVAESAEQMRSELAVEWLGRTLPNWRAPCPIQVHVGKHLGAGGATSFMFENGVPFGWRMTIQGPRDRLLDSVLPHEVTHTVFATHFGRALPRWADEGACTVVEHKSERKRQYQMLLKFLSSERGIPFNRMFEMTEYPKDIMPLYSQGYYLVRYLIAQGGKRKFVEYLDEGMKTNNWNAITHKHYGFEDLSDLQVSWVKWIEKGSSLDLAKTAAVARRGNRGAARATATASTPAPNARSVASRSRSRFDRTLDATLDAPASGESSGEANANSRSLARASFAGESSGGWYARRAKDAQDGTPPRRKRTPTALVGDGRADADRNSQTTSRPQPLQGPRTIILEWRGDANQRMLR